MAKLGRPTNYTPEMGAMICDAIAEGQTLTDFCADEAMPKTSTIGHWRSKHPDFEAMYAHARLLAGDREADNAKRFSEMTHVQLPNGMYVPLDTNRARLMADTAKWRASKLYPKNYGDKQFIEHSGSIAFTDMTEEDLLAAIQELMAQGKFDLPGGVKLVGDEPEDFDHEDLA